MSKNKFFGKPGGEITFHSEDIEIKEFELAKGAIAAQGWALNERGDVVGDMVFSGAIAAPSHNILKATVWTPDGKIKYLLDDPRIHYSRFLSVNEHGDAVGYSREETIDGFELWRPLLYRNSLNQLVNIENEFEHRLGALIDINDHGTCVGFMGFPYENLDHPPFKKAEAIRLQFGPNQKPVINRIIFTNTPHHDYLPGRHTSTALKINNNGQIIGLAGSCYFHSSDGVNALLDIHQFQFIAINNKNQIFARDWKGIKDGFIDPSDTAVKNPINPLDESSQSFSLFAMDCNDTGWVVGGLQNLWGGLSTTGRKYLRFMQNDMSGLANNHQLPLEEWNPSFVYNGHTLEKVNNYIKGQIQEESTKWEAIIPFAITNKENIILANGRKANDEIFYRPIRILKTISIFSFINWIKTQPRNWFEICDIGKIVFKNHTSVYIETTGNRRIRVHLPELISPSPVPGPGTLTRHNKEIMMNIFKAIDDRDAIELLEASLKTWSNSNNNIKNKNELSLTEVNKIKLKNNQNLQEEAVILLPGKKK